MTREPRLTRIALACCAWSERWFPDAFVFAAIAAAVIAVAALCNGARPVDVVGAFGDGFWGLIPFTMQMAFVMVGGYVVASSRPVARAIDWLAQRPRGGRGAVALIAFTSMTLALIHWGLGLMSATLLVQALARRPTLAMDYRAGAAAAYLGTGSVWALGLSSSAAQLQANAGSMPPALLAISGVIPFAQTIFLWQSMTLGAVVMLVSTWVAWTTAPSGGSVRTAEQLGVSQFVGLPESSTRASRPGEYLEYSPLPMLLLVVLGLGWFGREIAIKGLGLALSSLNTYNLLFLMLGLLLNWRPRRFLDACARAVPATTGILIQFPLYGSAAAMLTGAKAASGTTLAQHLALFFTQVATAKTFPIVIGIYSAVLGFFVPSGGGKWVIEAPYVLQAAKALHVHLGWAVQVYNAAEALPNLINPFWMLPLIGLLGIKARDLIGFSFIQFCVLTPLVLTLLWALGLTLSPGSP